MTEIVQLPSIVDVVLCPGDLHFGHGYTRIHTLLGSCIAITLWHPERQIGGMCHYLLPFRGTHGKLSSGHYGDEVIDLFVKRAKQEKTRPQEYEVKVFGGGNMLQLARRHPHTTDRGNVSRRNIDTGIRLLNEHGFRVSATDVGGTFHRKVLLELWSGDVWLQRGVTAKERA